MKHWIQAARLRTLPLAFACLGMGAILAAMEQAWDPVIFILSLATACLLQILSNLANDYGDAASGVDGEHREGPLRQVQSGRIGRDSMKKAIIMVGLLALAVGSSLLIYVFHADWLPMSLFMCVGLLSIWAAIGYTVGDNPYGYIGLGDLFVLLFFGWVSVMGSYVLYTGRWEWQLLLPATSVGLLAVAVLNVNNIRDMDSDKKAGKISIPVRLGRARAIDYHWSLLFLSMISLLAFGWLSGLMGWDWLFLLAFPFLLRHGYLVQLRSASGHLDPLLKQIALLTLLTVGLFGIGQLF